MPKHDTELKNTVPQRIATPTTSFSRRKGSKERAREFREAQKVQEVELNASNESGGKDDINKGENQTSHGREDDEPECRGRMGRGADEKHTATPTTSFSRRKGAEVRGREARETGAAAKGKSSQEVQTDPRRQSGVASLSIEEEFQCATNGRHAEKVKFTSVAAPFDEESVRREFEKLDCASSASSSAISTPQLTPRSRSARNGATSAPVDAAASKEKQERAYIIHSIEAAAAAGEQAAAAVLKQPVEQNSAAPREMEPTLEGAMCIILRCLLKDFMTL